MNKKQAKEHAEIISLLEADWRTTWLTINQLYLIRSFPAMDDKTSLIMPDGETIDLAQLLVTIAYFEAMLRGMEDRLIDLKAPGWSAR
jgi:hypothetical protein